MPLDYFKSKPEYVKRILLTGFCFWTYSSSKSFYMQIPVPSIFSEATKSLTIVIPAYNEERRLPSTLDETFRCAQNGRPCNGSGACQDSRSVRADVAGMSIYYLVISIPHDHHTPL